MQGATRGNEVDVLFSKEIMDWDKGKFYFLCELDERTLYCMRKIAESLDSTTWMGGQTMSPLIFLTQDRLRREKLFFGDQFQHIKLKNVPKAKKNLRDALESKQIYSIIR